MKRYGIPLGILIVLVLTANSPVLAHDECDMAMIADPLGIAIAKQFPEKCAQR